MATVKSSTAVAPGRLNALIGGVVGAVFVVVGLLGFTVSGEHAFAGHSGANLVLFQVNGLHNLIALNGTDNALHIVIGIVLVAFCLGADRQAAGPDTAGASRGLR